MTRGLNKVMLIGNLGADPEARYTASGQAIASFRVATSHYRKDAKGNRQEITEWNRVVAWEQLAEFVNQYLHKGRQVYVEGRLQTRQWTDQQGQNRNTTEIIANDITLLGGGHHDDSDDWEETPAAAPQRRPRPPATEADDGISF
jgi:single-strand DNA-binding protein